jgi:hypothetical protein
MVNKQFRQKFVNMQLSCGTRLAAMLKLGSQIDVTAFGVSEGGEDLGRLAPSGSTDLFPLVAPDRNQKDPTAILVELDVLA